MKEDQVIKEYTQHFERNFSFTPARNQFCFIDNNSYDNPHANPHEKEMFQKAITQIKQFTNSQQPFFCKDIKEVLKEKDSLLKHLKQSEAQRETDLNNFNKAMSDISAKLKHT